MSDIWSHKQNKSTKRKLWANECMINGVKSVKKGKDLREAARLYNVPVETLRRQVTGALDIACRPWPSYCLRVITSDIIASFVGEAWPQALTPLNIMGGFRIYPLNPGAVTDRQLAPSHVITILTHSQSDFTRTKGTAQTRASISL